MKLSVFLFALLIGMCLVLGIVLMTEEPEGAAGIAHPDYNSMLRGGDGATRLAPVKWVAWLLGLLQIAFFIALLAFGSWKKKAFVTERRVLWIGALIYAAFYLAMVVAYDAYAASGSSGLVLSFPPPTALMLYGVGFAPAIFIALYMLRFTPWILDDDEVRDFLEQTHGADD